MNLNDLQEQAMTLANRGLKIVSRFKILITVAIAGGAILLAVMQAQTYLEAPRDENAYTEKKSQVNVKNLDDEIVKKLEKTQEDKSESVEPNYDPTRQNPFAE